MRAVIHTEQIINGQFKLKVILKALSHTIELEI